MHPLDMMMQEHALITKLITVVGEKLPEMKTKKQTHVSLISLLISL